MMVVDQNMPEKVKVTFNVNFKTLSSLINSAFFLCMNFIDIKMHGTTMKTSNDNRNSVNTY